MHNYSDQMRKDGISEPMIQALYDFVTNYVKTRMYSKRYVECNSGPLRRCMIACKSSSADYQVMPSGFC